MVEQALNELHTKLGIVPRPCKGTCNYMPRHKISQDASQKRLGALLREAREAAGLTQTAAAAELHMDPGHLSRIERGRGTSRKTLIALASLYAKPLSFFGIEGQDGLGMVPRGTSAPLVLRERGDPLRALRLVQNDVERDLIESGAPDELLADAGRRFAELTRGLRELIAHAHAGTVPPDEPPLSPKELATFVNEETAHTRRHDAKRASGPAAATKAAGAGKGPSRAR